MTQFQMLFGERIRLRALEPYDVDTLYKWENDTTIWKASNTITPFSRFVLEQYIASSHLDLYTNKQLRLMITNKEGKDVGAIDLFDYDPQHQRAGIGILIASPEDRGKGYASEALTVLIQYCFHQLHLHQLYCTVTVDNEDSILLFQKNKFTITGIRKEWIRVGDTFVDEYLMQLIRKGH
ncbi:MAG: GNAT family N-acetyltransferase [Bacteroidia bacterium]|jgi:diamine N-acetyltransferase|nr:GNAT family N-acetyltransferase [Bacteroidia bacterium]